MIRAHDPADPGLAIERTAMIERFALSLVAAGDSAPPNRPAPAWRQESVRLS
jgi:hypothetical protein